jgi:hypothetical protein
MLRPVSMLRSSSHTRQDRCSQTANACSRPARLRETFADLFDLFGLVHHTALAARYGDLASLIRTVRDRQNIHARESMSIAALYGRLALGSAGAVAVLGTYAEPLRSTETP